MDISEGWHFREIGEDIRIVVEGTMPELPSAVEEAVESHWRAAKSRVAGLFNGRVFSADLIDHGEILGHFTEFRRVVAQFHEPSLSSQLKLRPMAVCGLLLCQGGGAEKRLVLGRRSKAAVFRPSVWESAPGGSLDPSAIDPDGSLDWRRQILSELGEELGVAQSDVIRTRLLGLVEYEMIGAIDLGVRLECALTAEAVLHAFERLGNAEFQELTAIDAAEADHLAEALGHEVHPATKLFAEQLARMTDD